MMNRTAMMDPTATTTQTPTEISEIPSLGTELPPRGPVSLFRPDIHTTGPRLPLDEPNWVWLDELRQLAWDLGISEYDLKTIEYLGCCPDQVAQQIVALTAWCANRQLKLDLAKVA